MAPRDTMIPPPPRHAYEFELSHETHARPEDVWAVLSNVHGWPRWIGALDAAMLDGEMRDGARGCVSHAGVSTIELAMENVVPCRALDVVWVFGPLVRTRTAYRIEETIGGATIRAAYQTRGYAPGVAFLTASGALLRTPEQLARLAFLAEEHAAIRAEITVPQRRTRAA